MEQPRHIRRHGCAPPLGKGALFVGAALLLGVALLGCKEERILAPVPELGYREDLFPQEAAARVDVLWVIDNSGSMRDSQAELKRSLHRFMTYFDRANVDYRIAVTTTAARTQRGAFIAGTYDGVAYEVVRPDLIDPIAVFKSAIDEAAGTEGSANEEAFASARLAIERQRGVAASALVEQRACEEKCPNGGEEAQRCREACAREHAPPFMRPNSSLAIVFLSDEDEQSFGELHYYQRYFQGALGVGNESLVSLATICGDVPTPPCQAMPGEVYVALARAMGGIVGSICDESFETSLTAIAEDAAGLHRTFRLSAEPKPESIAPTIQYRCDTAESVLAVCESVEDTCPGKGPIHGNVMGLLCAPKQGEADGWRYEESTNALFFHGASQPGPRSRLVVRYEMKELYGQ